MKKYQFGNEILARYMGAVVVAEWNDHLLLDYVNGFSLVPIDKRKKGDGYPDNYKRYQSSSILYYHSSMDWLMRVVEKINKERNVVLSVALENYNEDVLDTMKYLLQSTPISKPFSIENLWVSCVEYVLNSKIIINTCMSCGEEFYGEEPKMCCSGRECGCMGLPIEPVVCSNKCYELVMNKNK